MDLFYIISKIVWVIIKPGNLIFIFLFIGLIFLWSKRTKLAKRFLTVSILLMLIITTLPVGNWFLYPLEKDFAVANNLPEQIDGIIVLGGALHLMQSLMLNQVQTSESSERELAFMALARSYPGAKLYYAGAPANPFDLTVEGFDAQEELFLDQGFDTGRIMFDKRALNTHDNVVNWVEIMNPQTGDSWVLITSAFHMHRAIGIFCQAGYSVIPYPVDYRGLGTPLLNLGIHFSDELQKLEVGLKEWVGLASYWATGRTSQFLATSCN